MSKIKKILISSVISLVLMLLCTSILNIISNKDVIEVPIVVSDMDEGNILKDNVSYVEILLKDIKREVLDNIASKSEIASCVANKVLEKGKVILKSDIIPKGEYLVKIEELEYVSLPIKSATEGVSYKLKKGNKINVYYTAKSKLVESILKSKIKVYSTNKEEAMVTCLLYQNVEIISLTDNMGREVADGTATNILVRLKKDEILELANLKEQGVFTYSLI